MITAFQNAVADPKSTSTMKAKLSGFLKRIRNFRFICRVATHLEILEIMTPVSKFMEAERVLPLEIKNLVKECSLNIDGIIETNLEEDLEESNNLCQLKGNEDGELVTPYLQADDRKKRKEAREKVEINLSQEFNIKCSASVLGAVVEEKNEVLRKLRVLLADKFEDFNNMLFEHMRWVNPQHWTNDKLYGQEDIRKLAQHFEVPLSHNGFDEKRALKEWKSFRNLVEAHYKNHTVDQLWEKVFMYRQAEYPNLCLLAEIIFCISVSNSTVERSFSLLTMLLSNRRISMSHRTMQDYMVININDKIWTKPEREKILSRAVAAYLSKRRTTQMENRPNYHQQEEYISENSSENEDVYDDSSNSSSDSD